jgi:hypothetical protein
MDPNYPLDANHHVTAIETLGRQERHFRLGRRLLIGLGIGFIVAAVAWIAYLSITSAREVFSRHFDRIDAVQAAE